jgi:ketosteroid isomerase-like protein
MEVQMSESNLGSYVNSIEDLFQSGDAKAHEKVAEAANVRLIKDLIMAIGRDDLAEVEGRLAEDVRLEIRGSDEMPFIREAKGRAQMIEAIKQNFGALKDQRPTIGAVIAQGDTVIVMLEEEGEIRATGKPYHIKGMQRFIMREGKVELVEEQFASV